LNLFVPLRALVSYALARETVRVAIRNQ
jgi:hypothetical protein